jgi:hypothetical protein
MMRDRIFLLSHMRAYTSLLGHILGSHPEIDGYYEMHRGYRSPEDLALQAAAYQREEGLKAGGRYLFDKLLHNDYPLLLDRIDQEGVLVLIALREPDRALPSIVHLFRGRSPADPYGEPEGACRYYVERLGWLAAFAQAWPGRYHYFDAECLVERPQLLLATLTRWLALDSPLRAEYRRFSRTGRARTGDSSAAIASGAILRRERRYGDIALAPALQTQAREAYRACRQTLIAQARAMELRDLTS